jgi:hypothetical protein
MNIYGFYMWSVLVVIDVLEEHDMTLSSRSLKFTGATKREITRSCYLN